MPESISAKDSPFDVGEIIDTVLGQSAYFGETRSDHARTRKNEDLVEALKRGSKFGNNYFQNFVQHGIEDFPFQILFTLFLMVVVYRHSRNTFLTPKMHQLCQYGAQRFS